MGYLSGGFGWISEGEIFRGVVFGVFGMVVIMVVFVTFVFGFKFRFRGWYLRII